LPEMVDVVFSVPFSVLLVHERMLEAFVVARDRWLKPGGKVFPDNSTVFAAPFTDVALHDEVVGMSAFWGNESYIGIDISSLAFESTAENFGRPVVGSFHPDVLLCEDRASKTFDLNTVTLDELRNFEISFEHVMTMTAFCHGIACWFDGEFVGTAETVRIETGPEARETRWSQCRLLFCEPIAVNRGQILLGRVKFTANNYFSYDVQITAAIKGSIPKVVRTNTARLQDLHYRCMFP